jgi:hypothetical protein
MVSATDPYGRNLGFLDRSRYFFFEVEEDYQTTEAVYFLLYNIHTFSLCLTGNTILLRSVARNTDHQTTEEVYFLLHNIYKFNSCLTGNTIHLSSEARNSDH